MLRAAQNGDRQRRALVEIGRSRFGRPPAALPSRRACREAQRLSRAEAACTSVVTHSAALVMAMSALLSHAQIVLETLAALGFVAFAR